MLEGLLYWNGLAFRGTLDGYDTKARPYTVKISLHAKLKCLIRSSRRVSPGGLITVGN